jgi:hypothetical protein
VKLTIQHFGLADHILSALSAPNIHLADLWMFWDPDRFQHGVNLKVASDVEPVYVGSATNLGKKPNKSYGMQVRVALPDDFDSGPHLAL